jgi:serine-aspartate repeat-containing protein C/D/E
VGMIDRIMRMWHGGHVSPPSPVSLRRGLAGIESMESRRVFAVPPIHVGMTYLEQDSGSDLHGDRFQLTFSGGAAGTQLKRLELNGDQEIRGFGVGDVFFDTIEANLGADHAADFLVESSTGIQRVRATVLDGSTRLVLDFEGFDAGEKLIFSIDVDEVQDFDPSITDLRYINEGFDPITSGVEFQGSQFTATFTAPEFYEVQGSGNFRNRYDDALIASGLDLPEDDANQQRDRSAGAFAQLTQSPIPASIRGFVYHDRNDNGLRDPGEEGIAGVRVRLIVIDSVAPQENIELVTNSQGEYLATGIVAGRYRIQEIIQPAGYLDGKDTAGTINGQVRGIALQDLLDEIEIHGGETGIEFNFGELRPVSLEGNVHLATPNGDCFGESGYTGEHVPIVGARILLYDQGGTLIAETRTDDRGNYQFDNLAPGTYRLVEITPDGLIDGGARVGTIRETGLVSGLRINQGAIGSIVIASGQSGIEYDFCEFAPAAIAGFVYHDRDQDGQRETGEEGIGNAIVRLLDANGNEVARTQSDSAGRYSFTMLRAGTYTIVEEQPLGWIDGRDTIGTVGGISSGTALNPGDRLGGVVLRWGDRGIDYNFGEYLPGSLSGRVHLASRDGDCFGEHAEHRPVVGALVRLRNAEGLVIAETRTDSNGAYTFTGLAPGTYTIEELTPDGLFDGGAKAGTVGTSPRGFVQNPGSIRDISIFSGEQGINYEFCEFPPAMISGYVYHDRDQDGIRDATEQPIANTLVELMDANGVVVATTTTDAVGFYKFGGVRAGAYSLRETQPAGWLDGRDTPGILNGQVSGKADPSPGDLIREIEIGWGDMGTEFNFGEILPGTIRGIVFSDPNRDCVYNPAQQDKLLANVSVELRNAANDLIATTRTDSQGRYTFRNVAPGKYTVTELQPTGYFEGGATVGSHGGRLDGTSRIADIIVGSSQGLTDYNFCEVPPITISGYVFLDGPDLLLDHDEAIPAKIRDVRDGIRTSDDRPLPGVVMELRNGVTGVPILASAALTGTYASGPIRVITNADGYYEFIGLPFGNYAIYEVHPEGLLDGVDTPGSNSGVVFNPGEPQNQAIRQALVKDPENDAIVQIPLPAGTRAVSYNFSEVRVTRRPPDIQLPPLPPTRLPPSRQLPDLPPDALRPLPPALLRQRITPFEPLLAPGARSTWHLSILDAGSPRGEGLVISPTDSIWLIASSHAERAFDEERLSEGTWEFERGYGSHGNRMQSIRFGMAGATPIAGDFNGDGYFEVGIYRDGQWCIDMNGNGIWDRGDLWAHLGDDSDIPVTGDWDGDGKHDIGIFGPEWEGDPRAIEAEPGLPDVQNSADGPKKNPPPPIDSATDGYRVLKRTAKGPIRADVIDHVFRYGRMGDQAVVGDWNGDGIHSIGIYRGGEWFMDVDGDGRWSKADRRASFGTRDGQPLVGDFDGDGIDDLAFYADGKLYIDSNGNFVLDDQDRVIPMGKLGDRLVVGDWDGDGKDEVAIFTNGQPVEFASRALRR